MLQFGRKRLADCLNFSKLANPSLHFIYFCLFTVQYRKLEICSHQDSNSERWIITVELYKIILMGIEPQSLAEIPHLLTPTNSLRVVSYFLACSAF